MNEIHGKVAIITGGGGGIGAEIVKKLIQEGLKIVLGGRDTDKLKELKKDAPNSSEIMCIKCDVSNRNDLENLVKVTLDKFKTIDILINGAGVTSQYPFWEQPLEEIEQVIWTNYYGCVALTRLVAPIMKEKGVGHVINITSGSIMVEPPPQNFIVYSSLKVGLRSFAKGFFREMRDFGVKITTIIPGVTKTPLLDNLQNLHEDEDRLMGPEVVAETVLFALKQPSNVCPIELAVTNQRTTWKKPII